MRIYTKRKARRKKKEKGGRQRNYHFSPHLAKMASLPKHHLFTIAHLASYFSSKQDISGLYETPTSPAKLLFMRLHGSYTRHAPSHHFPCMAPSPPATMVVAMGSSIVNWKASRRAAPISITKAHGIKNPIQLPLSGQGLTSKVVLPVIVKTNNLFSDVFYKFTKLKSIEKALEGPT